MKILAVVATIANSLFWIVCVVSMLMSCWTTGVEFDHWSSTAAVTGFTAMFSMIGVFWLWSEIDCREKFYN